MSGVTLPAIAERGVILVVDDTPASLGVAASYLEAEGFQVAVAGDGEEALARAAFLRPDLILLDVLMPGIDGFETCRRLKSRESLRDTPVIFMTALTETQHKIAAFEVGGVDYITKPIEPNELLARVKTHLILHKTQNQLAVRNAQFATTLDRIAQGVCFFDRDQRLILCNRRYAEMYGLSVDDVSPGTTLDEISKKRYAVGASPDMTREEYLAWCDRVNASAGPQSWTVRLRNGHSIRVRHQQSPDGGWVATHEDITELELREASFRLLFENNPIPMWVYDRESLRFLAVNQAAVDHYGYPRERFLTMSILDIRPREDWDALRDFIAKGGSTDGSSRSWCHLKADGTPIEVFVYSRKMLYDGRSAALIAAIDVTERRRAEDELARAREFLDAVVENVPTPIVVKDASDFRYVLVNHAAETLLGIQRAHVLGRTCEDVYPKHTAATIAAHDQVVLGSRRQQFFGEHVIDTPGNGKRNVTIASLPVFDGKDEPQYLLTVIDDITEKKESQARIAHLAHHDALTDLPNRAAFNERLSSVFSEAESPAPSALLCLDVDRFKEVNDVFGHGVGDAVLCELSRRIQAAAGDAFLARLGGDEFVLISTGDQPITAAGLAERVLAAASGEVTIDGNRIRAGISIGIAVFPTDGADSASLLANADAALYRAKNDGRGTIRFFEPEMDRQLREKRALKRDLDAAVAGHQLAVHYQPQARIDGDVIGFEALIRWSHPARGLVPPDKFIPLAEESGLILEIGEWVLREAAREAASWPRPLQISVNLSPVQFRHGDLPGLVHSILFETGLAPGRLELEITEGVLVGDFSRAVSILRRLKALGVQIAMDDFGTGYSSLSYLQSFPFDKIKIDQGFVSNVDQSAQSAAIVRAVIGLGRGLDLPVVAEGVETKEQLLFLARESCDQVQGYLIGLPLPIQEYAEYVGRRETLREFSASIG